MENMADYIIHQEVKDIAEAGDAVLDPP